eukprot:gene4006-2861_t
MLVMPKRFVGEKIATTLRRQHQIAKHFETYSPVTAAELPISRACEITGSSAVSLAGDDASSARGVTPFQTSSTSLQGARNLRSAFLLGRERESKLQRNSIKAIRCAASKNEAAETFLLVTQSSNEKTNPRMVQAVCTSLLVHQSKLLMGEGSYNAAVEDASGTLERWKGLTLEEERVLALCHARQLSRYAEKGLSFDPDLGRVVEGADNRNVGFILHQVKKAVGDSMTLLPVTSLTDLMYLDISWGVALKLYDEALKAQEGIHPPVEMADRVLALMTGYKSDGIGSRPWEKALQLYNRVVESGYSSTLATHSHALDALWRSAESFHKTHSLLSQEHKDRLWCMLEAIQSNVQKEGLRIAGDDGCAYLESLVKAAGAAGRWDVTISILSEMDLSDDDASLRFLVPTPEAFLFAMAACNSVGHKAHSDALRKLFEAHYNFSHPHSEALLVYLQSLRHIAQIENDVGHIVEKIVNRLKKSMSRPCIVACLQLLSHGGVRTDESKEDLVLRLFDMYDNSVWLQEPVARKVELQTVFRSCFLAGSCNNFEGESRIMSIIRSRLRDIFGPSSEEEGWLKDTEIYALFQTDSWKHALKIFDRTVESRGELACNLPIPLYQVRQGLLNALLRSCRGLSMTEDGEDTSVFLDEDEREAQSEEVRFVAKMGLEKAEKLFPLGDAPFETVAELYLLLSAHTREDGQRKRLLARSLRFFSLAPQSTQCHAACLTPAASRGIRQEISIAGCPDAVNGVQLASSYVDCKRERVSNSHHLEAPNLPRSARLQRVCPQGPRRRALAAEVPPLMISKETENTRRSNDSTTCYVQLYSQLSCVPVYLLCHTEARNFTIQRHCQPKCKGCGKSGRFHQLLMTTPTSGVGVRGLAALGAGSEPLPTSPPQCSLRYLMSLRPQRPRVTAKDALRPCQAASPFPPSTNYFSFSYSKWGHLLSFSSLALRLPDLPFSGSTTMAPRTDTFQSGAVRAMRVVDQLRGTCLQRL